MRKFLVILLSVLFLLPTPAWALTTYYVRANCANRGDGTASGCAASPGDPGAYQSLQQFTDWRAGALADDWLVDCQNGGTVDVSNPVINGFTPGAYTLTIRGTGGSRYHLTRSGSGGEYVVDVRSGNTILDFLDIEDTGSGGGSGIRFRENGSKIVNSIIRNSGGSTSTSSFGIDNYAVSSNVRTDVINNLVLGWYGAGMHLGTVGLTSREWVVYYNTVAGSHENGISIDAYGTTCSFSIKGNLIYDTTGANYYKEGSGCSPTTASNYTYDSTSPDGAGFQGHTPDFVGGGDYRLLSGTDDGPDLSADPKYAVTTDGDGNARGATPDPGYNEVNDVSSSSSTTSSGGSSSSAASNVVSVLQTSGQL